jgi:hypothetical protein
MQSHIFVEESTTAADDKDRPVKEYYEGLFNSVVSLYDELAELTNAHLHVLSEEYGIASGEERMSEVYEHNLNSSDEMAKQARAKLVDAAADADVMVVLLSTDVFEQTVNEAWDELVAKAKPGSIWCLGAARHSLEELEFKQLEIKGCTVVTYQRVGVARLGTETREDLIEAVEQKAV